MSEKRKLILLTDYYPFTQNETFLENEIPYLSENFNLYMISGDETSEEKRDVPVNVKVFRIHPRSGHKKLEIIRSCIRLIFSRDGIYEIIDILKSREKILGRLISSFYFYLESCDYIKKLKCNGIIDLIDRNTIVYSYWSNYALLAFTQLRKKRVFKIVTRVHGYDLYNERYSTGRQPFKKSTDRLLDGIMCISDSGKEYYIQHFSRGNYDKIRTIRLGTMNKAMGVPKKVTRCFTICSCSNIIPIKRVGLIVEALKTINDAPIHWIHFGDGSDKERITQASLDLPKNIVVDLKGRVKNEDVLRFYSSNAVDCFITTSQTEGAPVSIMEALSFGIPIIATKVGGIPEMLNGTHNIMLSENPAISEISNAIKTLLQMDADHLRKICNENIKRWDEMYNAEKNNKKLIQYLSSL